MTSRVRVWVPACSVRGLAAVSVFAALGIAPSAWGASVVKCVDASGKVSYQANPCTAAQTAIAEPPPSTSAPRVQDSAAPPGASAARPASREVTSHDLAQVEADTKGARETWQRMVQATTRGDMNAALRELTPNAQERYRTIFETATKSDPPLKFDQLGEINAVTVSGGTRATIKVTRKKADGMYGYNVMLLKSPDGRWLIDMM